MPLKISVHKGLIIGRNVPGIGAARAIIEKRKATGCFHVSPMATYSRVTNGAAESGRAWTLVERGLSLLLVILFPFIFFSFQPSTLAAGFPANSDTSAPMNQRPPFFAGIYGDPRPPFSTAVEIKLIAFPLRSPGATTFRGDFVIYRRDINVVGKQRSRGGGVLLELYTSIR